MAARAANIAAWSRQVARCMAARVPSQTPAKVARSCFSIASGIFRSPSNGPPGETRMSRKVIETTQKRTTTSESRRLARWVIRLGGFQDFLGHGEIGGVRDLEIWHAMDNRHGMDASGDQGSDLIRGTGPMLADGGEKLREGCRLRGFHREEVLTGYGLLENTGVVGAVERILRVNQAHTTMPAATVSCVPGSTRMNDPVRRLRR